MSELQKIYDNLINDIDVRAQVIQLNQCCKEASNRDAFLQLIQYNMDVFRKLLEHDDPKVRKNAVKLIATLNLEGLVDDLWQAYEKEETLFVRPDYVKAMLAFNMSAYVEELAAIRQALLTQLKKEELQKHVSQELRALTNLLEQYELNESHSFHGQELKNQVLLTTVRGKERILLSEVKTCEGVLQCKEITGGVLVITEDLEALNQIRVYQEMLFICKGLNGLSCDPEILSKQILDSELMEFLKSRHTKSKVPFPFRIEARGAFRLEEKDHLVKKLSQKLEIRSKHRLINSTSNYEVEFRLIKGKDGIRVLLKLATIKDRRFVYRKHAIATSIQPYIAAIMMKFAKDYMKENVQVLDPFCGVGTMLIERNYAAHCHTLFGIDSYGDAIAFAKENTKIAGMNIHYINKPMEEFSHEYAFDQIVTNLPSQSEKKTSEDIREIYQDFLKKSQEWLIEGGSMIVHTYDKEIFNYAIKRNGGFAVKVETPIYEKAGSWLYVMEML